MVKRTIQMVLEGDTPAGEQHINEYPDKVVELLSKSFSIFSVEKRIQPSHVDVIMYLDPADDTVLIDVYASRATDIEADTFGRIMVDFHLPEHIIDDFTPMFSLHNFPKALDAVPYADGAVKTAELVEKQYNTMVAITMDEWWHRARNLQYNRDHVIEERFKKYSAALSYFKKIRAT